MRSLKGERTARPMMMCGGINKADSLGFQKFEIEILEVMPMEACAE